MTQQPMAGGSARTGPMPTAGRWGWYQDHEGNEFRRVSTLVKEVETDGYNLEQWKLRQVAEGLAIRDDLVLSVKAMGRPEDPLVGWSRDEKKKLDGIAKDAMQAAKQRDGARSGTAYHDLTERLDRGEPVDSVVRGLPAPVAVALRAYAYLRRENGWVNIETERTVVCDDLEVAGTFDRIDLVPGLAAMLGPGDCQYDCTAAGMAHTFDDGHDVGELSELPVIVDVKTEKDPTLNGLHIGPQLAIYSRSKRMWRAIGGMVPLLDQKGEQKVYERSGDPIMIPAGEYVPAPCVRQDVGIVVHVHDGDAVPYFINLNEGWEAAQAAYAQAERKSRAKRKLGTPGAWFALVPGIKRPPVAAMLVEQTAVTNPAGGAQVAVRGADGLVRWEPAPVARECDNCAPWVGGASSSRVDGTDNSTACTTCGSTAPNPAMVPIGTQVEVASVSFTKIDPPESVAERGPLDTVDRQAIESIWSAADVDGLRRIWEIYTKTIGRPWGGRVAEAGEARRRQVECVQRALHTAGTAKCACGWTTGVAP